MSVMIDREKRVSDLTEKLISNDGGLTPAENRILAETIIDDMPLSDAWRRICKLNGWE